MERDMNLFYSVVTFFFIEAFTEFQVQTVTAHIYRILLAGHFPWT